MKVLYLTLNKKWFDMILSGDKKEEYREIKPHWKSRLQDKWQKYPGIHIDFKSFDTILFSNGYAKDAPTMMVECKGISIGKARPEWSDNWQGDVYVIKLGRVLSASYKVTTQNAEEFAFSGIESAVLVTLRHWNRKESGVWYGYTRLMISVRDIVGKEIPLSRIKEALKSLRKQGLVKVSPIFNEATGMLNGSGYFYIENKF